MDKAVSDLWWRNAVLYCLDVETYIDADGDGVGDFRGLTRGIEHLAGLAVTCIWLMPFYPSPNRDDGYDISDYYNVDPRYGTLGDFGEFVRTALPLGTGPPSRRPGDRHVSTESRPQSTRPLRQPTLRRGGATTPRHGPSACRSSSWR
jgi:hypothetical protein